MYTLSEDDMIQNFKKVSGLFPGLAKRFLKYIIAIYCVLKKCKII